MLFVYGDIGSPDSWEGPPIGTFATPPEIGTDATETYGLGFAVEALHTLSGGQLTEYVDRLAWAFNQSMMRLPIGTRPWIWSINAAAWNWPLPTEDNPEAWTTIPRGKFWQRGVVEAVPDHTG